jgi:hypothetical protein
MSFLYPFTVSVRRASGTLTQTSDGAVQSTATILSNAPASIQLKRDKGFSAPAGFQGGATNTSAPMPAWMVYIPLQAASAQAGILDGDMVTDAATNRQFKVDAAEFTPLGWQLGCTPYKPDA